MDHPDGFSNDFDWVPGCEFIDPDPYECIPELPSRHSGNLNYELEFEAVHLHDASTPFETYRAELSATPLRRLNEREYCLQSWHEHSVQLDYPPKFEPSAPSLRMGRYCCGNGVLCRGLAPIIAPLLIGHTLDHRHFSSIEVYTTAVAANKLRRAITRLTDEQLTVYKAVESIMERKKSRQLCEKGASAAEIADELGGQSVRINLESELRTLVSRNALRREIEEREFYIT